MSDRLLNGFNNGRDTTDGVGGRPGLTEKLKTNSQLYKTKHCKTTRCRGLDEEDAFCPQCEYYYTEPINSNRLGKAMSKTNESILADVTPYDLPGSRNATYLTDDVLSAMTAAREDERQRIREIIQNKLQQLNIGSSLRDGIIILNQNVTISEVMQFEILNELLTDLTPCT